jgi:predicted DNA-binding transcriptional regulator AlpA
MARRFELPPNLPPRLIEREAAARYVNVSPSMFDGLVEAGTMPKPKIIGQRRKAWDVKQLDIAIDRLPNAGGDVEVVDETWKE